MASKGLHALSCFERPCLGRSVLRAGDDQIFRVDLHAVLELLRLACLVLERNEEDGQNAMLVATEHAYAGARIEIPAARCSIVRCGENKIAYE